jgi:predicted ferric reductase
MNPKKMLYIILILTFSSAFFIWSWGIASLGVELDGGRINQYTSKVLIMTAVALMALNFLLATRLRLVENVFGGFDRSYKVHSDLGKYSFVLILAHPILLSISALGSAAFANYYLPSSIVAYNLGLGALWLFVLLIALSVLKLLPYHWWKLTHKIIGLPMILAFLHAILIESYISPFLPFQIWVYGWFIIGIASYLYKELIYPILQNKHYVVDSVRLLGDITEYWLKPVREGKGISQPSAGKFVFVKITSNKQISHEEHPYSISDVDGERIRISTKALGDHSKKMQALQAGDKAIIRGQHGFFSASHPRSTQQQIWLAGGVGVTPFLGMLDSKHLQGQNVQMFYATKVESEAVYDEEVSQKARALPNVKLHKHYSDANGFMSAQWIMEQAGIKPEDLPKVSILQCGPPGMMKALEKQFLQLGALKRHIIYEEFSFN